MEAQTIRNTTTYTRNLFILFPKSIYNPTAIQAVLSIDWW